MIFFVSLRMKQKQPKKKFVMIGNIKVEVNKKIENPKNLDFFTYASYLIAGKIKPQNESDRKILAEAKGISEKGGVVEIPYN